MHTSFLIKSDYIWVRSESNLDYYLGQWVSQVSDANMISVLFHIPTTTGIPLAHVVLAQALCTQLSMMSPSVDHHLK